MKLTYIYSDVYDCFCKMNAYSDFKAVMIANETSKDLGCKIEKRFEYDEEGREHVKTVYHCRKCFARVFENNIKK